MLDAFVEKNNVPDPSLKTDTTGLNQDQNVDTLAEFINHTLLIIPSQYIVPFFAFFALITEPSLY